MNAEPYKQQINSDFQFLVYQIKDIIVSKCFWILDSLNT